jgi:transcriptional regulator with XRE-family HTH domain
MDFSRRLADLIGNENISAVAKEVGMPISLLHDWVKGRRIPSLRNLRHLISISNYLNMTLDELLGGRRQSGVAHLRSFDFQDGDRKFVVRIEKKLT